MSLMAAGCERADGPGPWSCPQPGGERIVFPLVLLCWRLTTSVLEGGVAIHYIGMFVCNKKDTQPRLLVYMNKQTLGGHQEMDNPGASAERNEMAESREGKIYISLK